ncbi:putative PB1 domain-containing protein [Helianthus annuus]|nr:putative PB1 domain-containing protein [Helianthus annuus]
MQSYIENAIKRFDFGEQSGVVLFWKYTALGHGWWTLTVKDQPFWSSKKGSTKDHKALERYRKRNLRYDYPIRPGNKVDQEWLAGLAARIGVSDQRTFQAKNQFLGQLVVPVSLNEGAHQILLGVIELVTAEPKENYVEEFIQIRNLLNEKNLATGPLAKMIKASYLGETVKFQLPISSGIPYLRERVTERFKILRQKAFRIIYNDGKSSFLVISNEGDLHRCIASSGSPTIRMLIE